MIKCFACFMRCKIPGLWHTSDQTLYGIFFLNIHNCAHLIFSAVWKPLLCPAMQFNLLLLLSHFARLCTMSCCNSLLITNTSGFKTWWEPEGPGNSPKAQPESWLLPQALRPFGVCLSRVPDSKGGRCFAPRGSILLLRVRARFSKSISLQGA